jgi:hypothetical protein
MVEEAFKTYPWKSLNQTWLTLQSVMNRIIKERGDNKFKICHMNKDRLERINQLPVSLVVTPDANNYPLNTFLNFISKATGGTFSMIYSVLSGYSALYPGTIFHVKCLSLATVFGSKLGADNCKGSKINSSA